ncbi:carboxylating nicotinate-nucleotide diphosphorylase [Rhodanobacter sp. C05]|uniref:carboxylating nicotinate-nucleotide diphosphorylase n=1 Tax=Rhodanobacter sp. C05 TaxID=1945855 RepID=UPI0009862701|nr:carboxylating nicotinate-nucleotide diphosphorylase [Rhodanobacter sp. C05]OOG43461.1 nicotinate-nucleotide diphosphorylase (carboxylating) [Rhodanobacter sp. C05]
MAIPAQIDSQWLIATIETALREDIGSGDLTTEATVDDSQQAHARIVSKEAGTICGGWVAEQVFKLVDPQLEIQTLREDGERVAPGDTIIELRGRARSIVTGERVALNFLQRMSGIATHTRKICDIVSHCDVQILDTRKTAPGLRALDKYSVTKGGGCNHRSGLYDMALIKENHVALAGGISNAVRRVKERMHDVGRSIRIEVEVETKGEFLDAVRSGADYIMLDNFSEVDVEEAVQLIRKLGAELQLEASGNITSENVLGYASTGVHRISMGSLTHSVTAFDLSLRIDT